MRLIFVLPIRDCLIVGNCLVDPPYSEYASASEINTARHIDISVAMNIFDNPGFAGTGLPPLSWTRPAFGVYLHWLYTLGIKGAS